LNDLAVQPMTPAECH